MQRPKLNSLSRKEQTVGTFLGYCRRPTVEAGQFTDMQNMTADGYPVLSPRKRRGVVSPREMLEPEVLHGRDGLWSLRTDAYGVARLYKNDKVIDKNGQAIDPSGESAQINAYTLMPLARRLTGRVGEYTYTDSDGEEQASTCLICPMLGDVDGNGKVTANDALMVGQILGGDIIPTPEQVQVADINGNGRVDSDDWLRAVMLMTDKIELPAPVDKSYYDITIGGDFAHSGETVQIVYNGVAYPAYVQGDNALTPLTFAGLPTRALYQFQTETENGETGVFVIQEGKGSLSRSLVSMGSYIVIFPDKVAYNTLFCEDTATEEQKKGQQPWTDLENAFYSDSATFTPCRMSDEGMDDVEYTSGSEAPSDPENGEYWLDTTGNVLKQYDASSGVWVSVPTAYVKIKADDIGNGFRKYDGVSLETDVPGLSGDTVIWDVGTEQDGDGSIDYIVVPGLLQSSSGKEVTVKRSVPDMDFVVELDNRLWGCSSDRHEIYASKLGDPTNWNCFMGLSTDSYAATIGTPGDFTGAAVLGGYVLFFKEDVLHRIYGTKPANFQITTLNLPGIQAGSHASAAVLGETLYYKGVRGIYATTGGAPVLISQDLGDALYDSAVGGGWDGRYAVSMRMAQTSKDSGWHLFVYDPKVGLWHRQDNTKMLCCASVGEELYYAEQIDFAPAGEESPVASGVYAIKSMGGSLGYTPRLDPAAGSEREEAVEWYVETGDIEDTTPQNMTVAQVRLRLAIESGSQVWISLRYDDDVTWQEMWSSRAASRRAITIPLIPRRCGRFRIRIAGCGGCRVYALTMILEEGSELRGLL